MDPASHGPLSGHRAGGENAGNKIMELTLASEAPAPAISVAAGTPPLLLSS